MAALGLRRGGRHRPAASRPVEHLKFRGINKARVAIARKLLTIAFQGSFAGEGEILPCPFSSGKTQKSFRRAAGMAVFVVVVIPLGWGRSRAGDGRSISHARIGYRRNAFRRGLPRTTHGRRVKPAHRILEDCLTLRSAPGRTGRRSDQDGAGATSCPIAQTNPHSSRAMAVTTTVGLFPVAMSLR